MSNKRQVFYNCNLYGAVPVSVSVYSLLRSADPSQPLQVYVAHDSGFEDNGGREQVRSVVDRFPFASVTFLNFEPIYRKHADVLDCELNQWSPMVWALCFFPDLIPDITGNLVFLDWDTFVFRDLAELYGMDLSDGNWIEAAVSESPREHRPYLIAAGWPEAAGCSINYGVQVIDTDAYRRERVKDRMLEWYARNRDIAVCAEQDSLNVVCGDRIRRLPVKYNFYASWLDRMPKHNPFDPKWRIHATRDVLDGAANPAIVHFIGHKKPWNKGYRSFRREYRRAMRDLGLLHGNIPGEGPVFRFFGIFADAYHDLMRKYAALQLRLLYHRPAENHVR